MTEPSLHAAVTLYLPPDVDRVQVGRLVKAMCSLNGIATAIELHPMGDASHEQVGWCDTSVPGVPIVAPLDPPGVMSPHRLGAPKWEPVFVLRVQTGDAGAHDASRAEAGQT